MTSCRKARVASIGHATSKCEAFCLFWPILVQCLRLLGPQNGRETVFPMFSIVFPCVHRDTDEFAKEGRVGTATSLEEP